MPANPFDQFDAAPSQANAFDQFDKSGAPQSISQDNWEKLKAAGYQPPAWLDWYEKNIGGPFQGFTEQVGRGATFGLQDKAGALVPALNDWITRQLGGQGNGKSFSENYQEELARERGAGQSYAENHPVASPVATGLGIATALAPRSAPAGMEWLGKLYRDMSSGRYVSAAPPLGNVAAATTVPQAAGQGMVAGGLTGLGQSNDQSVQQDLEDTGKAAALGGLTGGAASLVPKAVNAVLSSTLAHKLEYPALLTALLEGWHQPHMWPYIAGTGAGAGALYGLSRLPARVGQGIVPIAGAGGGNAVGLLGPNPDQ